MWISIVYFYINQLNLSEYHNNARLASHNSFILATNKLQEFINYSDNLIINCKLHSQACERIIGVILYKINNCSNHDIDGNNFEVKYNIFQVNLYDQINDYYFVKKVFAKNDSTIDI